MNCIEMVEKLRGCAHDEHMICKVNDMVNELDFGDNPELRSRQVVAAVMVLGAEIRKLVAKIDEMSDQIAELNGRVFG